MADPWGPDVVIPGAPRSGTSALAARLTTHPDIDGGKLKEPHYFSRHPDRTPEWYDDLYEPRRPGLLRLDASTSYASSEAPDILERLLAVSPAVRMMYAVRRPSERALSHYFLKSEFFAHDGTETFGSALQREPVYLDAGDYARWLPRMRELVGPERVLVLPFEVVTRRGGEAADQVCGWLGLPPPPDTEDAATTHQNQVVAYRSDAVRRLANRFRQSALYPRVRGLVGASRLRKARSLVTKRASLPTAEQAWATCTPAQRAALEDFDARAGAAVLDVLVEQDRRLGLDWAGESFAASVSPPARG